MAYAAVADVQKYFINFTFSASSKVTDTDVGNDCDTESEIIDQALRAQGYTVPVTGTKSLKILKRVVVLRVAAVCWDKLYATTEPDEPTKAKSWRSQAKELFEPIASGLSDLPDAQKDTAISASEAPRYNKPETIFKRDDLDDFVESHGGS